LNCDFEVSKNFKVICGEAFFVTEEYQVFVHPFPNLDE